MPSAPALVGENQALLSGIGPKRQFGQALFALAKWSGSPYSAQMKGIF
jgi:hypothetical protein